MNPLHFCQYISDKLPTNASGAVAHGIYVCYALSSDCTRPQQISSLIGTFQVSLPHSIFGMYINFEFHSNSHFVSLPSHYYLPVGVQTSFNKYCLYFMICIKAQVAQDQPKLGLLSHLHSVIE